MKHKLFSKRGLALVVSVMMCLSAMSTTAWAGNFDDLQKLINDAKSGEEIKLKESYTYGEENDDGSNRTDNTHTITITNKDITLDLNGNTISGADKNNNSVITVGNKGNLTLKDDSSEQTGEITGGTGNSKGEGGGIYVGNGGTFTMTSGTITENHTTNNGGGVYLDNNATFKMEGGTITKNTANNNGGGVAVWGTGKFEMTDGTISENTANNGGGVSTHYAQHKGTGGTFTMSGGDVSNNTANRSGGGVYAEQKSTITMSDGSISGNSTTYNAIENERFGGGGVFVDKGSFTMSGGSITGNTSAKGTSATYSGGASGGGVYMLGGQFNMSDGEISGNTASGAGEGGGIYGTNSGTNSATINMTGGKITDNTADGSLGQGGGGVRVWGASFTMSDGELTGNKVTNKEVGASQVSVAVANNGEVTGSATITGGTVSKNTNDYITGECKNEVGDNYVVHEEHSMKDATCTEDEHCENCPAKGEHTATNHVGSEVVTILGKSATCEEAGLTDGKRCKDCGTILVKQEEIPANGHTEVAIGERREATCGADGITAGVKCDVCGKVLKAQEPIPATGDHTWGDWGPWSEPDDTNTQTRSHICTVCGATEEQTRTAPTTDDDTDDDPGTTILPEPVPMGEGPATATIADEDVPLAGLVTLAQLLDELYRHEGAPEVHIPDGFPFADHEYAEAICWGLDNALVFHTEEEPLDPDEIVTVGLMREVLTNFVAYRGVEEFTVELAGADDEIVMDLGERLVVFYAQLAEAEAAAETDETEAA